MKNQLINLKLAKKLKKIGFNKPVPHCFINNDDNNYDLELFSFFLGSDGTLAEIYEEEKILRNLDPTKDLIQNESEVYFNYNQDIRKLVARLYNGEEYMNDPKSYNIYVDSYKYNNWSYEEVENNKKILPNYNDGDFDFITYRDVISAPNYYDVIEWIEKTCNINIYVCYCEYGISSENGWKFTFDNPTGNQCWHGKYKNKIIALEHAIKHVIN